MSAVAIDLAKEQGAIGCQILNVPFLLWGLESKKLEFLVSLAIRNDKIDTILAKETK